MTEHRDRRATYPLFPGQRPVHYLTVLVEPGSTPRLNSLPGFRPYIYRGSGRDTLTGWMDATMSLECLDERCGKCTDPDCACACEHEHRRAS